jgi:hypothetical protein
LFYKTLLQCELFVLTDKPNQPGPRTLQENEKIRFVTLNDGTIPVFTSAQRILDGGIIKTEVPYMAMGARGLFEITLGAKLILNPFSDNAKEFTPPEIEQLLSGRLFDAPQVEEIKKETRIRIGQPASFPKEMQTSIVTYCTTQPDIQAAFVAMMQRVDTGEAPNLVIGVEMTGDEELIFGELNEVVQEHLQADQHIDFIRIEEPDNGGLSAYFKTVQPFYKK